MEKSAKEATDKEIIRLLGEGKSQSKTAELVALSPQTISRRAVKYRDLIRKETEKLFDIVPEITEQLKRDTKTSNKLSKFIADPLNVTNINETALTKIDDILRFQDHIYKKQSDVLKATGIFPANNQNIFVQNIHNDNRTQVLSPEVFKALGGIFSSNEEEEIDDAEWEEIDENL